MSDGFQPLTSDGLVGQILAGRMRVLDRVHAGPRSRIYEVEPPGVGEVRRALKVLCAPEAREPEVYERLQTLADVDRGIDHPHLERVFTCGRLSDDTPYLACEWLPLPSLASVLKVEGGVDRARALQIIEAVAAALGALHARGLVHGDVRPEHVLVAPGVGGFERVVLVDAGVDAALDTPPSRSLTGALAYRAPERLDGATASAAADLYALGVMSWQLITGRLPFRPDDLRAAGVAADPAERLRWLHHNALPLRPSVAGGALLPPAVEAVIGRAMAKDPRQRPSDADRFLDALDAARAGLSADDGEAWFHAPPRQATDPSLPAIQPPPPPEPAEPEWVAPVGLAPWLAAGLACGIVGATLVQLVG
ncbi:MAG: serine/threonine protein kinase [Myxococcales bacterium]|nr:serine/threonine protein kinase [Myxococcales bacterium]